jgi:plastocyanin
MENPLFNKKILTSCIIISILFIGMSYSSHYLGQSVSAKKSSSEDKASSSSSSADASASNSSSTISLNALELKNETYRWQNSSEAINPTLHLVANTDYNIKIKNPTDTKHELIIGSNGTELAKSSEIKPDKSVKFTFNANSTGTLEYHCEYHPDTMKGTIEITGQ